MKSLRKRVSYADLVFEIFRNVYEPAEDTFLAADNLNVNEEDIVLDVGTGCGLLAIVAAQRAKKIVAVDLNPYAIRCVRRNAEINKLTEKIDVRKGDLFKSIKGDEKFSLIIFNAPYLPTAPREERSWLGKAWAGGLTGRQLIDRFITETPRYLTEKGRVLLVQSSLASIDETLKEFQEAGFEARVIAEKRVAFETIVVIQASHLCKSETKGLRGDEG